MTRRHPRKEQHMNRDVCEHFNPVDLPCDKCNSVQKSTLREAAQQALEVLGSVGADWVCEASHHAKKDQHKGGEPCPLQQRWHVAYQALRAALAEPEDWELRRLREELERCKQTCAATSEAWREEAALAEMKPCNKSCAPGYCYCECPHGVTDGNCKERYGKATNSEPFTVYTTLRQRGMTCPSCEYNKQRAQLWRNEAYKLGGHPLDWEPELMVRPKPLTDEEIRDLWSWSMTAEAERTATTQQHAFARAIEQAHGIGEKE